MIASVPPRATGSIETYAWKDGRTITYRARVRANGRRHRIDFGTNHEGWNEQRARVELDGILERIARGTWEPALAPAAVPAGDTVSQDETIHVTVSRWWQRRRGELKPRTQADYRWRIDHVLLELAHEPTAAIDVRRVDAFRSSLSARGLAPRSVNMVLDLLAQVLDDAVDHGQLQINPARGKRRRMKVRKPERSFLEPDMVLDLLDAAGEWELELPAHQHYGRRAFLSLLCLSGGPRISEATLSDRGEVDLHSGRWRIPEAKTDAGERDVELTAFTLAELRSHLARRPLGAGSPLFPTRTRGRLNASNIRNRLLPEAVKRANEVRAENGRMQLPKRVTPHTLRRTFAMLALTAGRDPRWVMAQMGHADARLTLSVYAQVIQRQRVDYDLVWRLMRFADEQEDWPGSARRLASGPTNGPIHSDSASGATASLEP